MNQTLAKILKFISRSTGFFFINLAVILILLAFFINSSINNIDSLKTDLQSSVEEIVLSQSNLTNNNLNQIQEYCKNNKEDERCSQLSQLNGNGQFNQLFEDIKSAKNYINLSIFASLILLFFGLIFIYLGTFNLFEVAYRVNVHLTISNFLAALYFNFIPNIFNSMINSSKIQEITNEIPREFLEKIISVILNWIKAPVFATIKLTITLGIIFLIISIILYVIKKKGLKDKNKTE